MLIVALIGMLGAAYIGYRAGHTDGIRAAVEYIRKNPDYLKE